jgi:hypothetical protein
MIATALVLTLLTQTPAPAPKPAKATPPKPAVTTPAETPAAENAAKPEVQKATPSVTPSTAKEEPKKLSDYKDQVGPDGVYRNALGEDYIQYSNRIAGGVPLDPEAAAAAAKPRPIQSCQEAGKACKVQIDCCSQNCASEKCQ